jgi:hypothetical protein
MFYLIEIAKGDTKIEGKAVYEYHTQNEAISSFHSKMGNAMKSELFESELLLVIDSNGTVVKREKYIKPIPPETED